MVTEVENGATGERASVGEKLGALSELATQHANENDRLSLSIEARLEVLRTGLRELASGLEISVSSDRTMGVDVTTRTGKTTIGDTEFSYHASSYSDRDGAGSYPTKYDFSAPEYRLAIQTFTGALAGSLPIGVEINDENPFALCTDISPEAPLDRLRHTDTVLARLVEIIDTLREDRASE